MLKSIIVGFVFLVAFQSCAKKQVDTSKPNIIFIMMDDLGYGQLGLYNDTLKPEDFDPWFVYLVDSLQGYSKQKALEFSKKAMPTLTTLAKNGILFTNAHASSNLCAPSRLGIATGTLQNRWGIYTNTDCEKMGIVPGTHLAEQIKAQGYATAHIGKWHIGKRDSSVIAKILKEYNLPEDFSMKMVKNKYPEVYAEIRNCGYTGSVVKEQHPLNNGFDYYYGYNHWASQFYNSTLVWENFEHAGIQTEYNTDVFTNKAIDFITEQVDAKSPFYLQIHYHAVHDSLEPRAPDVYFDKFDAESYDLNNFYAHVYGVDYNLNRIIKLLKEKGEFEKTMLIFTSDNGAMSAGLYNGNKTGSPLPGNAPFAGHKGNYQQGGFRVPMFVHWPNKIKTPGISEQLVSTMDILPTAVQVSGGRVPANVDGKSLLPCFENTTDSVIHDHLLWSGINSSAWGFLITKTTKTHDTERPFAPPAWVIRKDDFMLRYTGTLVPGIYVDHLFGRAPLVELFNVKTDPAERINLAEEMPEKVKELSKIYFNTSKEFLPPVDWDKNKWNELVESELLFE